MRADPATMREAGRFTIPQDHPALAGHFPGRPVVPGVVVIDHAAWLIGRCLNAAVPAGLRETKFLAPVLAGQEIETRYTVGDDGRTPFVCLRAGQPVVTGVLVLYRGAP